MANKGPDEIEWDVDAEILLFEAVIGHKPVGVNRYFMMASIHNKLSNHINKQMSSKPIWQHLDTMYDMAALHESEILPFPNEEIEFILPGEEYDDTSLERLGVKISDFAPASSTSPSKQTPNSKHMRKATSGKQKQSPVPSTPKAVNDDAHFRKPLPQTTPVSVKLSKNPLPDSKNSEKSTSNSPHKGEKAKVTKQPELMHAEVKVEPATHSLLKKALKLEKGSPEEKEKKPRDSTSGAKVSKSSSESQGGKSSSHKDDSKVSVKSDMKKDSSETKSSTGTPTKSAKKESSSSSSTEKSTKDSKHESSSSSKAKRMKTDSKKSEPPAKRRRT